MARAKYKLGQFIKTTETEEQASESGVIEEIRTREDGHSYMLTGLDGAVAEEDVAAVYRPVVPRQPKSRATNGKSSKKKDAGKASSAHAN